MSAIASFYVVPEDRMPEIVAAATPTPAGWFRPRRDVFWDVLRGAGRQLPSFERSGWVFNTLELYLESRRGYLFSRYGDDALSDQLSKPRRSSWQVVPPGSAAEWLWALDGFEPDAGDLTAFIAGEYGPKDAAEGAMATRAALAKLREWLGEVAPGSMGLLSIG